MVTRRLRPLRIAGRVIHQIGLPFHWGFAGEAVGDNANDLTAIVADPNVSMHEGKVFTCQVRAGRRDGAEAEAHAARGALARAIPDAGHAGGRAARGEVRPWRLASSRSPGVRAAADPPRRLPILAERLVAPFRRGTPPEPQSGDGVLHRHDGLHRLQGVRGRLQAVEPAPGRRVHLERQQLRQHRRRCRPRPGGTSSSSSSSTATARGHRRPLADDERRLQALRRRALPGGLPDRRDHLQRVRQRLHPAGHLQRLRATASRPARSASSTRSHDRRPRPQVHALLRPPARRPGAGLRQGVPDRVDPVRAGGRAAASGRGSGWRSCTARASPARTSTATAAEPTYSALNSFYLLVDRPRCTGCRRRR